MLGPFMILFLVLALRLVLTCSRRVVGITGRNMPFAEDGQSLGGGRAPDDARAAALKVLTGFFASIGITAPGRGCGGGGGLMF